MNGFEISGWVEIEGRVIPDEKIHKILLEEISQVTSFGGEFLLRWDDCAARDNLGIMQGNCPPGKVVCGGKVIAGIDPNPSCLSLDEAIRCAVSLRKEEGIVALSGGVDSSLVAALAGRECVAVGTDESHDLRRARAVALYLGLKLDEIQVNKAEVEDALIEAIGLIPNITPVDAGIATTLWFVARYAGDHGHRRILAGQGADELFGGYARYIDSEDLEAELKHDLEQLPVQLSRDQAVAARYGAYFSLPYLDLRVIRCARNIPPNEKVRGGERKIALRAVAGRYLPPEISDYEKKAMQYGSGIWKIILELARENGYKKSIQGYINHLGRVEHGIGE